MCNRKALAITEKAWSSVEKAANFPFIFVLINPRRWNTFDYPVIVLKPTFVDFDTNLVVPMNGRRSFVDHQCPQEISLIIAFLFKLLQPLINSLNFLAYFFDLSVDPFDFFFDVKRCGVQGCLS